MFTLAKSWVVQSKTAFRQVVLSKRVFTLWLGYAGMLLLSFLSYPILTKWYSPQQFGILAVFSNSILIYSAIGAVGFEKAIVIAKSRTRALNLLYLSAGMVVVTGLLCGSFIWLFEMKLLEWLELPASTLPFLRILPLFFLMAATFQIGSFWFLREQNFKVLSKLRLLQRVVVLVGQIGIVFFVGTIHGLLIGLMAGVVFIFAGTLWKYFNLSLNFSWSYKFTRQSWQRFSDFSKFNFPQTLIHQISARIPFLLIPAFFGLREAGFFSVAYALLSLPESFIATAVGESFFQKISSCKEKEVVHCLKQYWLVLLLLALVPFGYLTIWGEETLVFFLGADWQMAGSMMSFMGPVFLLAFISTPTSTTLMVLRKQKITLIFGCASFIFRPALFYLGYLEGGIFYALFFWMVFEVIQNLLFLLVVYKIAQKHATNTEKVLCPIV